MDHPARDPRGGVRVWVCVNVACQVLKSFFDHSCQLPSMVKKKCARNIAGSAVFSVRNAVNNIRKAARNNEIAVICGISDTNDTLWGTQNSTFANTTYACLLWANYFRDYILYFLFSFRITIFTLSKNACWP